MPVGGHYGWCILACATDSSKCCPYVYTLIASQTINVSQTRITSEARGRKCVAFRRRFRKKSKTEGAVVNA